MISSMNCNDSVDEESSLDGSTRHKIIIKKKIKLKRKSNYASNREGTKEMEILGYD